MIQQISHHDLEHAYADAVNTIQSQMNFVEAVQQLESVARAREHLPLVNGHDYRA